MSADSTPPRLRLAGVDTAYASDAGDDALIGQANAERRVLLTQDRGLLRRRALWLGAYVRGARPDDQLRDVLDRFRPPLAPWTRCPACNGPLSPVAKAAVAAGQGELDLSLPASPGPGNGTTLAHMLRADAAPSAVLRDRTTRSRSAPRHSLARIRTDRAPPRTASREDGLAPLLRLGC